MSLPKQLVINMWVLLLIISLLFTGQAEAYQLYGSSPVACIGTATAFTSTQTGNFNDGATWGNTSPGKAGTDYPCNNGGDTFTVGNGHTVTVPAGYETISSGALSGTSTLTVTGSLTLDGNLTLATSTFNLSAGSTLDLDNHDVITSGTTSYNFIGTSGSRVTIKSTTQGGNFLIGGAYIVKPVIQYADISNLGDSDFGRTHSTTHKVVFEDNTVTSCGYLGLDLVTTTANAGFSVRRNTFRNPSNADPVTNLKYQPYIYQTAALGTTERVFSDNTYSTTGAKGNFLYIRTKSATVSGNVLSDVYMLLSTAVSGEEAIFTGNFLAQTKLPSNQFFPNSGPQITTLSNNYIYYAAGDHPLGSLGTYPIAATGNIIEAGGDNYVANWFLWGAGANGTYSVKNNIFLGVAGVGVTVTGASAPTSLDISNNTFYVNNKYNTSSGLYFSPFLLTEQSGALTGTVVVYNNILVDPDSTTTPDPAVDMVNNTADQVDYLDYNAGYAYTSGVQTPPLAYTANVVVTAGEGVHDISVDPQFVDKTRTLAAWDASLGGPGTAANAITQLLARTAGYTASAAVTYIKAGFSPTAADYATSGRGGGYPAYIGAVEP